MQAPSFAAENVAAENHVAEKATVSRKLNCALKSAHFTRRTDLRKSLAIYMQNLRFCP